MTYISVHPSYFQGVDQLSKTSVNQTAYISPLVHTCTVKHDTLLLVSFLFLIEILR